MPKLPGTQPTDEREFRKNTSEQYAALGRFVEAFELMVNKVRESSIDLVAHDEKNSDLVSIAFHHHALSAMPLMEIFRAVCANMMGLSPLTDDLADDEPPFITADDTEPDDPRLKFSAADRDAFNAIMKRIFAEYKDLSETRNALLHGTWFVGYGTPADPNASTFRVHKLQATKIGLTRVEDLPKSAPELITLAKRCEDTRNWIWFLEMCVGGLVPFKDRFVQERGDWLLLMSGHKTPLPRTRA